MQLTKFSKLEIIHTPGKILSVADMISRSLTKTELQINHFKQKQIPPQIDFAILQNNTLQHVQYLIKHSHPILADCGTDQFSIRMDDKGNDVIIEPLDSFFYQLHLSNPNSKHPSRNTKNLFTNRNTSQNFAFT